MLRMRKFGQIANISKQRGTNNLKVSFPNSLSTKQKIYNVFYVSLLEQDTIKKRQMDNILSESEKKCSVRL